MTVDLLPTLAKLGGGKLPKHRLDGKSIWPLMAARPGAKSPHEALFFYWGEHLQAVRSGPWKLHLPHDYPAPDPPGVDGKPGKMTTKRIETELFDLNNDPGETANVADRHPDIVKRLEALAEQCRADLGDSAEKRLGRNVRPPGRLAFQ